MAIWLIVLLVIILVAVVGAVATGSGIAVKHQIKKNKENNKTTDSQMMETLEYDLPADVPIKDIPPNEARTPPKNPY